MGGHLDGDHDQVHVGQRARRRGSVSACPMPSSAAMSRALSSRLAATAVISYSSRAHRAGMCAVFAHPRSGVVPTMPTRILAAVMSGW
ncbi:MAG TPA: hypothetical protein VFA92_09375 [Candidatus Binatia bacterium]|nr:hypothetical protein [Candidatus Binatia bacterium]